MNAPMNTMIQAVTLAELRARLAAGTPLTLIEALPARHYDAGHLPGAINLDHDEVDARAPTLLPHREAELVVYCAGPSCMNSHKAAARLVALGYRKVGVFAGGKTEWEAAGMSLCRR